MGIRNRRHVWRESSCTIQNELKFPLWMSSTNRYSDIMKGLNPSIFAISPMICMHYIAARLFAANTTEMHRLRQDLIRRMAGMHYIPALIMTSPLPPARHGPNSA